MGPKEGKPIDISFETPFKQNNIQNDFIPAGNAECKKIEPADNSHKLVKKEEKTDATKSSKTNLKKELETMLRLILANVSGSSTSPEINVHRQAYVSNPALLQLYDKLLMKYYSAKKCREDIVRYILRKFFKILRTDIIKKEKVSNKKASLILCQKYFSSRTQEMEREGVKLEKEEDVLEFMMPFKKNSKNRTMNTNFVCDIFSSPELCKEYTDFLAQFERFLNADNNRKLQRTVQFLAECVQQNNLTKFNTFNRLPWLDSWVENTKDIAFNLIPADSNEKLLKKEELF